MANKDRWNDDYWLLLIQLFMKKPEGVKPPYSKELVKMALDVHIHPEYLYGKMCQLTTIDSPRLERLWNTYSDSPQKLRRAATLVRQMMGFNNPEEFYDGVKVNETFERLFRPIDGEPTVTPLMLVMVLDLYFRLTPITMNTETPEVRELAKLIKVSAEKVVEILDVFQHCDPYLHRDDMLLTPLSIPCQQVWQEFATIDTEELVKKAEAYSEYFK